MTNKVTIRRMMDAQAGAARRVIGDPPSEVRLRAKLPNGEAHLIYTGLVYGASETGVFANKGRDQYPAETFWSL